MKLSYFQFSTNKKWISRVLTQYRSSTTSLCQFSMSSMKCKMIFTAVIILLSVCGTRGQSILDDVQICFRTSQRFCMDVDTAKGYTHSISVGDLQNFKSIIPTVKNSYSGPAVQLQITSYHLERKNVTLLESVHVEQSGTLNRKAVSLVHSCNRSDTLLFKDILILQTTPIQQVHHVKNLLLKVQ